MEKHTKNDAEKQDITAYAMLPVWLIRGGKEVTHGALRMYAAIKTYTKNGENVAWPSQETLAKDLGFSVRQVRTMLKQLEACGGVRIDLRLNDDGTLGRNYVYTLAWDKPFKKHRKDTAAEIVEESCRNTDVVDEIAEESCRSTEEESCRSIEEESCRLTTPTEHTLNSSKENPLGKAPLSGAGRLFVVPDENQRDEVSEDEAKERAIDAAFAALGRKRKRAS